MLVKTFGSKEQRRYTCDIVNIVLDARNWSAVDLQLVAVPLICNPLSGQNFPQLTDLDLADSASCDNDLQVDILIRCNYYWRIVTGNLIYTVAIKNLPCGPCHGSYVTQLNTLFALHVNWDPI